MASAARPMSRICVVAVCFRYCLFSLLLLLLRFFCRLCATTGGHGVRRGPSAHHVWPNDDFANVLAPGQSLCGLMDLKKIHPTESVSDGHGKLKMKNQESGTEPVKNNGQPLPNPIHTTIPFN